MLSAQGFHNSIDRGHEQLFLHFTRLWIRADIIDMFHAYISIYERRVMFKRIMLKKTIFLNKFFKN